MAGPRKEAFPWILKIEKPILVKALDDMEVMQKAMTKLWPCPNCKSVGYEYWSLPPEQPAIRCLCCSWTGYPVEPAKKKASKRKREALPDGSIRIDVAGKIVVLPPNWKEERVRLIEKLTVDGFLTEDENDIVQQAAKELTKEKKVTTPELVEEPK
jgi:hypothetical protein